MAVLQAYQADLLKELDEGEQISSSDVGELRRTADLALRATKETAHAIGRSMDGGSGEALMVDSVRHEREGQSRLDGCPACAFWAVRRCR